MNTSIILPTYNEKDNIVPLIKSIISSVGKYEKEYEILVIDDNSPDKTATISKNFFSKNKHVKVFVRKKDKGLASAILYGITKSKGKVIVVMDTDFSHDPNMLPKMLSLIKNYDIVIGSRYVKSGGGENKKRYWLSRIYNIYLRIILRIKIADFLFGYFCVKRNFIFNNNLAKKSIFTGFGDYFIRFAYFSNKAGARFIEIPTFYKDRVHGYSKSNIIKMFITYTNTSLRLMVHNFLPKLGMARFFIFYI